MVLFHGFLGYNIPMERKENPMTKQPVDFVSIDRGAIRLYAGDKCIGLSNSAHFLADLIQERSGGPAWKIMSSSLFIEALAGCDDAAQEGGFNSAKEVADLWDEVCSYV